MVNCCLQASSLFGGYSEKSRPSARRKETFERLALLTPQIRVLKRFFRISLVWTSGFEIETQNRGEIPDWKYAQEVNT